MPPPPEIAALAAGKRLRVPLLVRAGSAAYGLETPESDEDYVGLFVAPAERFLSIEGLEADTYTGRRPDFTLHEIGKFCRLALKGNPAILETLWNPAAAAIDAVGEELVRRRRAFLHRRSLEVYLDYARSQLKRMTRGKALHSKGGTYNGKYGAHLIRLLRAGIHLGRTGEVQVRVEPGLAKTLLEIRAERVPRGRVIEMARPLTDELQKLADRNALPERPDVEPLNALVAAARRLS